MFELILIIVSLCITTFAVCLTANVRSCLSNGQRLNVISILTFIPLMMLWLGYLFGDLLRSLAGWEHQWMMMLVLFLTGSRMLIKTFRSSAEDRAFDLRNIKVLLLVAFALGMNSLIIGTGLSFTSHERAHSFLIFLIASLSLSIIGLILGKKIGKYELGNKAELLGGFVLLGIGFKIALQLFGLI